MYTTRPWWLPAIASWIPWYVIMEHAWITFIDVSFGPKIIERILGGSVVVHSAFLANHHRVGQALVAVPEIGPVSWTACRIVSLFAVVFGF